MHTPGLHPVPGTYVQDGLEGSVTYMIIAMQIITLPFACKTAQSHAYLCAEVQCMVRNLLPPCD